jgi:hypothetical protein
MLITEEPTKLEKNINGCSASLEFKKFFDVVLTNCWKNQILGNKISHLCLATTKVKPPH